MCTRCHNSPRKPTILLLGRPFYEDPRDFAFNFGESGYCPSDGHLLTNAQSVFGTTHKLGLLKGVAAAVYCAYTDSHPSRFHSSGPNRIWQVGILGWL